jgi:two-component system phosphate regulon response regulator PhoB
MKKILIVDDDLGIRKLVDATLRAKEYQIFQAESGEKAIKIARTEKPDLIIMDIMMPAGMDGFEATRIIKSDPETKNCAIVILSGTGQDAEKEKGLAADVEDYFTKPFSPLELIRKVGGILG